MEKAEWRRLKKFLRSPYVTHREDIFRMYECLASSLYKGNALPDKQALHQYTYPTEHFNAQRLRNTMSELHQFVENFIVWEAIQKNNPGKHLTLSAFYRQRNLSKHFRRNAQKLKKTLETQSLQDPEYFQNLLDFQIEDAQFQATHKRTNKLNLQEIDHTMDVLYLSRKLRHACTLLSHRAVYQTDYDFGLLREWIDVIEGSDFLDLPFIAIYYYCYRYLTESYSQEYFQKFREELSAHKNQFSKEELKDLYRAAINFCIRKLNEGSLAYAREGWELFREGLKAEIFIENGQLSRFTFDNIVGFGLRLKEFAAVNGFISDYQHYLDDNYRSGTVAFNLARLEYERRDFSRALTYLSSSIPKDLVNQLISKTLSIKIYYELEEFDLLAAHLDSFRSFIRRNEVSDYHRKNFQKIIYYTQKIMALAPFDAAEKEKLITAIKEEHILTEREWLLQKLG